MTEPTVPGQPSESDLDWLGRTGVETVTITAAGETQVLVPATEYLRLHGERDDLRRALALINAWSIDQDRWDNEAHLRRLLDKAGMTIDDARAMQSLIGPLRAAPSPSGR